MTRARELANLAGVSETALSNRNLVINGAAEVYQRGAATTTHNGYAVDRWQHKGSNSTASTSNQDTDAPAPFINSIKFAAGGASSGASETAGLCQRIEGNAMTSLGWGTSAAKPATLSFYVKSSVTGTYAVSARNNGVDQSYINTYTISSANTWEYKTVTFDARTTGTWLTTNGIGMRLWFDLGSGSNFDGTAGSWTTNNHLTVSSQADVVGTSSATWFVTGVQLEVGEQATPFEHRSFGDELAACQRYYYFLGQGTGSNSGDIGVGSYYNSSTLDVVVQFPVTMRSTPSLNATSGTDFYVSFRNNSSDVFNSFSIAKGSPTAVAIGNASEASGTGGQATVIRYNNASASVGFDAEL
tara:strand:- start:7098 stop:8168 length:1071 start_codon:yes stop_codon:yes gene_type:complete